MAVFSKLGIVAVDIINSVMFGVWVIMAYSDNYHSVFYKCLKGDSVMQSGDHNSMISHVDQAFFYTLPAIVVVMAYLKIGMLIRFYDLNIFYFQVLNIFGAIFWFIIGILVSVATGYITGAGDGCTFHYDVYSYNDPIVSCGIAFGFFIIFLAIVQIIAVSYEDQSPSSKTFTIDLYDAPFSWFWYITILGNLVDMELNEEWKGHSILLQSCSDFSNRRTALNILWICLVGSLIPIPRKRGGIPLMMIEKIFHIGILVASCAYMHPFVYQLYHSLRKGCGPYRTYTYHVWDNPQAQQGREYYFKKSNYVVYQARAMIGLCVFQMIIMIIEGILILCVHKNKQLTLSPRPVPSSRVSTTDDDSSSSYSSYSYV